jgi:Na+/proline symporter
MLLIVTGAILTFAVHAKLAGLDLHVVGWVFMLAGVAGLVLFFTFWNRRRVPSAVPVERRAYDDAGQPPA